MDHAPELAYLYWRNERTARSRRMVARRARRSARGSGHLSWLVWTCPAVVVVVDAELSHTQVIPPTEPPNVTIQNDVTQ
jgi:hypothetical protein